MQFPVAAIAALLGGELTDPSRAGHVVTGVRSPHSLLGKGATYGEGALGWDGAEAAGFSKIHGMQAVLAAQAGNGKETAS